MTTMGTAKPPIRDTRHSRRVLLVLLTGATNIGGGTIWHLACGPFSAGNVYLTLARLESAGWVTSERESPEPQNRPRRRFYKLTGAGRTGALQMMGLDGRLWPDPRDDQGPA